MENVHFINILNREYEWKTLLRIHTLHTKGKVPLSLGKLQTGKHLKNNI